MLAVFLSMYGSRFPIGMGIPEGPESQAVPVLLGDAWWTNVRCETNRPIPCLSCSLLDEPLTRVPFKGAA